MCAFVTLAPSLMYMDVPAICTAPHLLAQGFYSLLLYPSKRGFCIIACRNVHIFFCFFLFFKFCVNGCFVCIYVYAPVCAWCPQGLEEDTGSPRNTITDDSYPEADNLNPGPLEKQQVLLTTEPSLQAPSNTFSMSTALCYNINMINK